MTLDSKDYAPLEGVWSDATGASNSHVAKFDVQARYTLNTGGINAEGTNPGEKKAATVTNTATGEVSRLQNNPGSVEDTEEIVFVPGTVDAAVTKTDKNGSKETAVISGGEVEYSLTVENTGTEPIVDPVITDVLPSDAKGATALFPEGGIDEVKYSKSPASASITTDPTEITVTSSNEGDKPFVKFEFPAGTILLPGEKYTVKLPIVIRAGLAPQDGLVNKLELTSKNGPVKEDSAKLNVKAGQSYAARKLVREVVAEGDTPTGLHNVVTGTDQCNDYGDGFYRYPCVVATKPGGTAEWKLSVTNSGNIPADKLEIVDIFPHVGDFGVVPELGDVPRKSEWAPEFLGLDPLELPDGAEAKVSYLTSVAACKPNGRASSDAPWGEGCPDSAWSTEAPVDLSSVAGLKIVVTYEPGLAPGASFTATFKTKSLTEMPEGASEENAPAWNSFGYHAEAMLNGNTDRIMQEPNKTGITFKAPIPQVSVGDYVWVDNNNDGRQTEGEPGIPGVVLELIGPDNLPVTDVNGTPVESVTTDKDGKYIFEGLPVLKDGESYTVKIDREKSKEPLAPYAPALPNVGDREGDSSDWEASTDNKSIDLTQGGAHDPTLDFGFVLKETPIVPIPQVSVGDYVWVDTNNDGRQTEGEPGIAGVVLDLFAPNGKKIGSTETDKDGKYIFEGLPVLKDGESYTVKIDREKSKEPLAPYAPALPNVGDREGDSSDWEASTDNKSIDLTQGGAHDPTLDFGFVLKETPIVPIVPPVKPTDPSVPLVPLKPSTPGKVSVGDKVWVDSNKDGKQDKGEPGIPNVVLDLFDPSGKKIRSTTTDKNGKYIFKDLPVLKDGQSYTVKINKKKSKEALAPYVPTIETDGDRENASSTWESSSWGLTKAGEADLTLDFGFVLQPETVEPPVVEPGDGDNNGGNGDGNAAEEPTKKPEKKPEDNLVATGFASFAAVIGGLVLILGGMVLVRRRTKNNEG